MQKTIFHTKPMCGAMARNIKEERLTPEERLARLEESISSLKQDMQAIRNQLTAHENKDEVNFQHVTEAVNKGLREVIAAVHTLEVSFLKSRRSFWILLGLLFGSGVLAGSGVAGLLGGG